jgi:hypothetical protein
MRSDPAESDQSDESALAERPADVGEEILPSGQACERRRDVLDDRDARSGGVEAAGARATAAAR